MFKIREADLEKLSSAQPPFLHIYEGQAEELLSQLGQFQNINIKVLNGKAIDNDDNLLSELSLALEFPSYFGDNFNALWECLTDLSWLDLSKGMTLILKDADKVFSADQEMFIHFINILRDASVYWAIPRKHSADGHDSIPLNLIIQIPKGNHAAIERAIDDSMSAFYVDNFNNAWNDDSMVGNS